MIRWRLTLPRVFVAGDEAGTVYAPTPMTIYAREWDMRDNTYGDAIPVTPLPRGFHRDDNGVIHVMAGVIDPQTGVVTFPRAPNAGIEYTVTFDDEEGNDDRH